MITEWLYFGCGNGPGHYVFREGMVSYREKHRRSLSSFDGMLPPQDSPKACRAVVSRLPGWGLTALAWWDYSVDDRGGSNSVVFAPSLTITPEDLLTEAQRRFPKVFARQHEPLRLIP